MYIFLGEIEWFSMIDSGEKENKKLVYFINKAILINVTSSLCFSHFINLCLYDHQNYIQIIHFRIITFSVGILYETKKCSHRRPSYRFPYSFLI